MSEILGRQELRRALQKTVKIFRSGMRPRSRLRLLDILIRDWANVPTLSWFCAPARSSTLVACRPAWPKTRWPSDAGRSCRSLWPPRCKNISFAKIAKEFVETPQKASG